MVVRRAGIGSGLILSRMPHISRLTSRFFKYASAFIHRWPQAPTPSITGASSSPDFVSWYSKRVDSPVTFERVTIPRESLRRCTATISARIEMAISSGVIAPRSSPAGALSLARRAGEIALSEQHFQRFGFLPAADEGNVIGIDRERGK